MNTPVKAEQNSLKQILNMSTVKKQLNELLQDRASQFASSLVTLASNDTYLADSEPMSIVSGAMQAAQLGLPLEKQFGFVYLIPFNTSEVIDGKKVWVKKAQFVLGYRGYIQLAQRSGQYRAINVGSVYEGQLKSWDPFREKLEFDPEGRTTDEVVGYFGYFELLNGFEKTVYWTKDQIEQHRIQNNKAKNKKQLTGVWVTNYDAMAQKTVLRSMLSKWGILSIEMQSAILADEGEGDLEDEVESEVRRDVSEKANQELVDFDQPSEKVKETPREESNQEALFNNLNDVKDEVPVEPGF